MDVHPSFSELRQESVRLLGQFLLTELDLGFTFVDMTRSARLQKRAEQLRSDVQSIIETIHRFKDRLPKGKIKAEILKRCAALEKIVSTLSGTGF